MFLIQRNRHALLGRAMDQQDMKRVLDFLSFDPVTSILLEGNVSYVLLPKHDTIDLGHVFLGCGCCL